MLKQPIQFTFMEQTGTPGSTGKLIFIIDRFTGNVRPYASTCTYAQQQYLCLTLIISPPNNSTINLSSSYSILHFFQQMSCCGLHSSFAFSLQEQNDVVIQSFSDSCIGLTKIHPYQHCWISINLDTDQGWLSVDCNIFQVSYISIYSK